MKKTLFIAGMVCFAIVATGVAQQTSSLTVKVEDRDGNPMSGAEVTAKSSEQELSGVTGADGVCVFSGMQEGNFIVTISRDGYESYRGEMLMQPGRDESMVIPLSPTDYGE